MTEKSAVPAQTPHYFLGRIINATAAVKGLRANAPLFPYSFQNYLIAQNSLF